MLFQHLGADQDVSSSHKRRCRLDQDAIEGKINIEGVFVDNLAPASLEEICPEKRGFTAILRASGSSKSPLKPVSTVAGQSEPPIEIEIVGTPLEDTSPWITLALP